MEVLIEAVIDYADARAAEGLKLPGEHDPKTTRVCPYWSRGSCTRGNRCKQAHTGPGDCASTAPGYRANAGKGAAASAASRTGQNQAPGGGRNKVPRCRFDEKGQKCTRVGCRFRHDNHKVNPPAANQSAKTGCKCCGGPNHKLAVCRKRKQYAQQLKSILGCNGQLSWFNDPQNSKKCVDLFKAKGWLCRPAPTRVRRTQQKILPFQVEDNWLDGGWCWIGHGKYAKRLRLYIDLGST